MCLKHVFVYTDLHLRNFHLENASETCELQKVSSVVKLIEKLDRQYRNQF